MEYGLWELPLVASVLQLISAEDIPEQLPTLAAEPAHQRALASAFTFCVGCGGMFPTPVAVENVWTTAEADNALACSGEVWIYFCAPGRRQQQI